MGMTSAAEANLDARVRPQIVAMRSRTPYPKPRQSEDSEPQATAVAPADTPARINTKPGPIRLTRRGRIVVGTLIVMGVAAAAGLIWFAIAGQAQASSQLKPGPSARNSVLRVVVKPGQTLWGIAAQADPSADPRVVISQIEELNSLSSTSIFAGQVLWVPRG